MRRREFITLLGAAAWPLAAGAQPAVRRVGVLIPRAADDRAFQARVDAFAQRLQQLGWSDGRNVRIDIRWAGGHADAIAKLAAELAALAPDVVFAHGGATLGPLLKATPLRADRFRRGHRSGRRAPSRKPCAAWRQRHRLYQL